MGRFLVSEVGVSRRFHLFNSIDKMRLAQRNLLHQCSHITCMAIRVVIFVVKGTELTRSRIKNNYFAELRSGSEECSFLRLIAFGITQL